VREDDQLLKQFVVESEAVVEGLLSDLQRLADQHARGRVSPDLLNRIFRSAHSIKGMAGMAGLRAVQSAAHRFEDLLDDARMGRLVIDASTVSGFARVAEGIGHLIAAAERGHLHDADAERLVGIVDSLRMAPADPQLEDTDAFIVLDDQVRRTMTEYEEHRLLENLRDRRPVYELNVAFDLMSFDAEFRRLSDELAAAGEAISTLPGMGSGEGMQIAFRILYASDEGLDAVAQKLEAFGGSAATLTRYPEPADVARREPIEAPDRADLASSVVRVDMRALDEIAVLVQQLALRTSEIVERYAELTDGGNPHLRARDRFALRQQRRAVERGFLEVEERIVGLRLVPLAGAFARAERLVRRVAEELGREVEFGAEGADVPLDKAIVDRIAEPLTHLLNNAVDHGIEPPAAREAAGKPRAGRVLIRAEPAGSRVVVSVSDDGAGIDFEGILRAAAERGIAAPDGDVADPIDLIFQSGVSTAARVSSVSGRGVGMDAVAAAVAELGGEIAVETARGVGTTVRLTLPTTLVMASAFFVEVAGLPYAVEVNQLSELCYVDPSDIGEDEGVSRVEWRATSMPFVDLAAALGVSDGLRESRLRGATERIPCLVARAGERHAALAVDRFVGEREVIVKSLGRYGPSIRGVNGAVDLEGGRVALLLDIAMLMTEEMFT
jgi:two-component system, chemotaxis family, sensor kinase CheA